MPKVSILLTSYNHDNWLRESIDSILNQTFSDFELFIVDDGSKDKSWEIIKSYNDDRITPIRHKKNEGKVLCEELVSKFNGEYFAISHSDDYWHKDKLKKQVEVLDNNKQYAACFTGVNIVCDDDIKKFPDIIKPYQNVFIKKNMNRFELLRHFITDCNCLCHPSCMIRMDVQIKEKLFTQGLGSLPDFYRWVKLCLHHDIYLIDEELTYFRVHINNENMSGIKKSNINSNLIDLFFISDLFFEIEDEDILKVFPEAEQYIINGKFNKDYIISMMLLNTIHKPLILAAVNKLYKLVNDPEVSKEIYSFYGFSERDFKELVSGLEVFSQFSNEIFMSATLRDYNNPNDEAAIHTEFINVYDYIYFTADVSNFKSNHLCFIPDECSFRKFENIIALADGENVPIEPYDTFVKINNGVEFYTTNPKFIISINKPVKKIEICFKSSVLPYFKVQDYLNSKIYNKQYLKRIKNKIKFRK